MVNLWPDLDFPDWKFNRVLVKRVTYPMDVLKQKIREVLKTEDF